MKTQEILPIGTGLVLRGKHFATIIGVNIDNTQYITEFTGVTSHFPKGEKDYPYVRDVNNYIKNGRYTTI